MILYESFNMKSTLNINIILKERERVLTHKKDNIYIQHKKILLARILYLHMRIRKNLFIKCVTP